MSLICFLDLIITERSLFGFISLLTCFCNSLVTSVLVSLHSSTSHMLSQTNLFKHLCYLPAQKCSLALYNAWRRNSRLLNRMLERPEALESESLGCIPNLPFTGSMTLNNLTEVWLTLLCFDFPIYKVRLMTK